MQGNFAMVLSSSRLSGNHCFAEAFAEDRCPFEKPPATHWLNEPNVKRSVCSRGVGAVGISRA